jgi:nitrate/TMAO reductase-like tetraheme cytochrome c subunit
MDENRPVQGPPASGPTEPPTPPPGSDPWDTDGEVNFWQNFRWFLSRAVALMAAFVLMGAALTGLSGWYTSRSEFCRSCHIMEPYYVSWQESSHHDVSCIKCHFPPGAGEKIRGKLLGLVQLVKYVTETAGPRPAAEIPDASCLRGGCHETRLLSGRIEFHGMPFDHRPHLEEPKRGKQLRCTSCHSQIVQGSHMTVTPSTCYLCHFKDVQFNEGLGACTRCHEIPEKEFELGGGTKFTHDLAIEKGVDCIDCHADLIRGNGDVPRERCSVCHNREDDFKRIDDHVFMHETHVTDHHVGCLACHQEIQHVRDPQLVAHAAADCSACHAGQHREQVALMQGVGARTSHVQISGKASLRISCMACHRQREVSPTGTVVWKATADNCLSCHDREMTDTLEAYHKTLQESLEGLDATLTRIRAAAPAAEVSADRSQAIAAQLEDIVHDVTFLRVGDGIHNIHYADHLTRNLVDRLTELCRELNIEVPEIALPEPLQRKTGTAESNPPATP